MGGQECRTGAQRVRTPVHSFEKYKRSHCHGSIAEGSANEYEITKKVFWDKHPKFCKKILKF